MNVRGSLNTVFLAAAIWLTLAAAALGAPAGDEYLPYVPGAAGKQAVGGDESGSPGSSILSPAVPSTKRDSGSGSGSGSGSDPITAVEVDRTSSPGSSGAGATLTNPVALLVIVGVGTAALAMTLRRRRSLEGEPAADLAGRDPGSSPPTPDGEIAGGDDKD